MFDVANIEQKEKYQFAKETLTSELVELEKLDLNVLGIKNTEFGNNKNTKDVYVVSNVSGMVYYLQGVEYKEKIYYTLDDELYQTTGIDKIDVLGTEKDTKNQHVIFSPNTTEYTSSPVVVTVKIPIDAMLISADTQDKTVSETTILGGYKQIVVNNTGNNRDGNYYINIKYSYKNSIYEATYNVTNFDNTKPTVSLLESERDQSVLVTITAEDNLSGIKSIKFVEGNTQDIEYFKLYGKNVLNNKFNIGKYTGYSVCVEDNAGNYNIVTKTSTTQVEE